MTLHTSSHSRIFDKPHSPNTHPAPVSGLPDRHFLKLRQGAGPDAIVGLVFANLIKRANGNGVAYGPGGKAGQFVGGVKGSNAITAGQKTAGVPVGTTAKSTFGQLIAYQRILPLVLYSVSNEDKGAVTIKPSFTKSCSTIP